MKQTLFAVCLFTLQLAFSQEQYSTITQADTFISLHINAITFNDKPCIINEEYCAWFDNNGCGVIHEIGTGGEMVKRVEIENFHMLSRSVAANNNIITLVGQNHPDSITIIQLDTAFTEVNRRSYFQPEHLWTFGMIEFGPYLVVSTFDFQGTEDYFNSYLYWIDKATLETMETMTGEAFRNRSMIEMKLSPDSILHVLTIEDDSVYMLQFDDERNWVGTVPLPSHGFIPSANFVILDNGNMVYGLEGNSFLKCIDAEGTLLWQCDLAAQFIPEHLDFVYEIETASNGDILVCGPSNGTRAALIARISNAGQVLWARVHEVSIAKESFLFDIIETPDSSILYTGSVKMVEPAPTSAHDFYWMLKTNQLGCIDTTCLLLVDEDGDGYNSAVDCNDLDASINPGQPEIPNNQIDEDCDGLDGTTATAYVATVTFAVVPNPTNHFIQVVSSTHHTSLAYIVADISGQPLMHGKTGNLKIDLGALQAGIYLLRAIGSNGGPVFTTKIVKVD